MVGVDVARGLALIGMMATHAIATLDVNDNPTVATVVASGRAAATYVLVAGVSLAFLSGRRTAVRGRERIGVSAGLVVRAVLVGALGLALGYLGQFNGVDGILPFYGLLFLLAIPLLGCARLVLIGIAAAAIALGPLLIVTTAGAGLPRSDFGPDPTFSTLVHDPVGLLVQLSLTGAYPAIVFLAYLCVGLVIGRLDLGSRRTGWWLFGGGLALALAARAVSALLLYRMGGLARLIEQNDLGDDPAGVTALLWEPDTPMSWWYLALPTPHSHTPVDLLHTLGSAAAVLGVALLLTRLPVVARALAPLAAAGSMSLTLYVAHLVLLATGVLARPAECCCSCRWPSELSRWPARGGGGSGRAPSKRSWPCRPPPRDEPSRACSRTTGTSRRRRARAGCSAPPPAAQRNLTELANWPHSGQDQ